MAALKIVILLLVAFAALFAAVGCDQPPPRPNTERVVIKGTTFWLDGALDEPTRIKGLGGRESLPDDGGMIFVFPAPVPLEFVMRDCKFDIDIAFIDDAGRVVAMHTMKVEPRREGESDMDYEMRLKRYPSRFPVRFAVEVMGGTFEKLGLKPQDVIELDAAGLKRRAK